jgi:hypothetical protein
LGLSGFFCILFLGLLTIPLNFVLMDNQPIGILTQALAALQYGKRFTIYFPMKTIYLADSKNAPYGKKSKKRL